MKGEDMTVNEIINLLDKKENKYGGATGKERELKISINGEFLGSIESSKLDGWGDGLVTDVTLEVEVDGIESFEQEIRAKVIDEFAEKLKAEVLEEINEVSETQKLYEVGSDMSTACSDIMGTLRDVYHRIVDKIAEQLKAGK